MSARTSPGWFGKITAVGDFASRRLSDDWVRTCDQWLSQLLTAMRAQLGDRWLAAYLAAPLCRFTWGPGVIDSSWWFGVLMPSCDNVGRYFPLVIAQARSEPPADRIALDHLDLWWGHLARAAMQTLVEGATLEAFESDLLQAPLWPGAGPLRAARPVMASVGEQYMVPAQASTGDLAHALAASLLQRHLHGASLWWPLGQDAEPGRCTVLRGLPVAADFIGMLRRPAS